MAVDYDQYIGEVTEFAVKNVRRVRDRYQKRDGGRILIEDLGRFVGE